MARALLPLLALTLTACTGAPQGETTDGAVEAAGPRDMLVVAAGSDIHSLIPVTSSHASDGMLMEALFVPTLKYEFDCSLKKKKGGFYTDWEWSEDGKILKLGFRDDIEWADGKPVTVEDLAFTYELVRDEAVASPRIGFADRLVEGKSPLIVDSTHVEFHFTEAYDRDTQMSHVSLELMPKHIFADADRATLKGHPNNKQPLVNGPWKLLEHKPNERIVLAPNDAFTGDEASKAHLKRVMFKIVPEYQTRLLQLKKGEIDMMESVRIGDADALRETNDNLDLVRRGYRFMDYVAWNTRNELFADKEVRRALAKAVDIDTMIERLLTSKTGEKFARKASSTITPELCGVHNDAIEMLAHNAAESTAMLAAAGWKDSNGDGVIDKDGKPFRFTLITNRENERRMEAAQMMQMQFKAVGVDMQINTLEFGAMTDLLKNRTYEAALAGWSAGLFVDPSDMWHCNTETKKYEFNYPGYCSEQADALIDKGLATADPMQAAPIWKELQQVIYDDQPYLFLWWRDEIVAIDKRFEHVKIDVGSALNDLHAWEVPADKVKYKF
jgi:peptide/nickel transport system substrate-binding protein